MNDFSGLSILVEENLEQHPQNTLEPSSTVAPALSDATPETTTNSDSNSELLLPPLPAEEDVAVVAPTHRVSLSVASSIGDSIASLAAANPTANSSCLLANPPSATSSMSTAILSAAASLPNSTPNSTTSANTSANTAASNMAAAAIAGSIRSRSVSGFNSPYEQSSSFDVSYYDDSRRSSDYSELLQHSYLNSLDHSNASEHVSGISTPTHSAFPSIINAPLLSASLSAAAATPTTSINGASSTVAAENTPQSTLPLKRLTSLKNGIRKLSLSSKSQPQTPPQAQTQPPPPRPILAPLQTQTLTPHPSISGDSSSSNSDNSWNLLLNQITLSKRSRAFSASAVSSPGTTPFASPVITISDNLQNSKKSLLNIEQSYFDAINSSKANGVTTTTTKSSLNSFSENYDATGQTSPVYSVSELSKPSELIDYFVFLKDQKKSTIEAFEVTRKRLEESGWCSQHDLNNLQLQEDSSLCQIDTKLLQVKERLDSEFNMSLFNTEEEYSVAALSKPTENKPLRAVELSPSLRSLENRCFSFAEIK